MRRQSKWIYKKRKCTLMMHFLFFCILCTPMHGCVMRCVPLSADDYVIVR